MKVQKNRAAQREGGEILKTEAGEVSSMEMVCLNQQWKPPASLLHTQARSNASDEEKIPKGQGRVWVNRPAETEIKWNCSSQWQNAVGYEAPREEASGSLVGKSFSADGSFKEMLAVLFWENKS